MALWTSSSASRSLARLQRLSQQMARSSSSPSSSPTLGRSGIRWNSASTSTSSSGGGSSSTTNANPSPPRSPSSSSSSSSSNATLEVLQRKNLAGRIFTLNRPTAFNALNLNMIRAMTPQLQAWERSDMCNVILLKSDHPKAFCAGGDVKTIADQMKSGKTREGIQFMYEEYQLDHYIATTPKPFVAFMDGITMGGGVGLSVHAPFRVATERTVFAMPETAIGLFPDVGGSFFLPRLDGELGTYLALTGERLRGGDVVTARIATHYVPSERLSALTDRLCELEVADWSVTNAALEEFAQVPEPPPPSSSSSSSSLTAADRDVIDRCFRFDTIEEIQSALTQEGSEFAARTLATLSTMSPLSLTVTLAQLRKGKEMDIATAFHYEWCLVNNITAYGDFVEGVTHKLVRKATDPPHWPSASMTPEERAAVAVPDRQAVDPLVLLRPSGSTYTTYPHRCFAMPSLTDVQAVVRGEDPSVGDFAFTSVEHVEDWFSNHWPTRHLVQDALDGWTQLVQHQQRPPPSSGSSGRGGGGGGGQGSESSSSSSSSTSSTTTSTPTSPPPNMEELVGMGKVGVREHVRAIVNRMCTVDPSTGVKWRVG